MDRVPGPAAVARDDDRVRGWRDLESVRVARAERIKSIVAGVEGQLDALPMRPFVVGAQQEVERRTQVSALLGDDPDVPRIGEADILYAAHGRIAAAPMDATVVCPQDA